MSLIFLNWARNRVRLNGEHEENEGVAGDNWPGRRGVYQARMNASRVPKIT